MKWRRKKRFHAPKIVHTGTPERRIFVGVILLLLAALGWNIFDFGREQGGYESDKSELLESTMLADIDALEADRNECKQLLARFEKSSEIDRTAAESLRKEIVTLNQSLARTEKQLAFYRGLLDEGYKKGLQIRSFALHEQESGEYRYQILLTLLKTKAKKQTYTIKMTVVGKQKDKKVSLDNKKLGIEKSDSKAEFKHYHEFHGDIKIPADMTVEKVKLAIVRKGQKKAELSHSWHWEELFAGNELNGEKKEVQTP